MNDSSRETIFVRGPIKKEVFYGSRFATVSLTANQCGTIKIFTTQ
jgi:hypothetical protein